MRTRIAIVVDGRQHVSRWLDETDDGMIATAQSYKRLQPESNVSIVTSEGGYHAVTLPDQVHLPEQVSS